MSTSNRKEGKLHHSDLSVTCACHRQRVGKLCGCCSRLGDMAGGSSDPAEPLKAAAAPWAERPLLSCCSLALCWGQGAAWSWTRAAQAQMESLVFAGTGGALTPTLGGLGWFGTPPLLSVRPGGSRASNVTGIWGLSEWAWFHETELHS